MDQNDFDVKYQFEPDKIDERVVLESETGTLFHIDLKLLTSVSNVFEGMIQPTGCSPLAIPLSFATTSGLHLFLRIIGLSEKGPTKLNLNDTSITDHIVEAVRIAIILDVKSFGERVIALSDSPHTCGLRYAIGKAFGVDISIREYHPLFQAQQRWHHSSDMSFPLEFPDDRAVIAILEKHCKPKDIERWERFRKGRKAVLTTLKKEMVVEWPGLRSPLLRNPIGRGPRCIL